MNKLKEMYQYILDNGEDRDTRSGKVRSIFDFNISFDLQEGFPAVTGKQLAMNPVVGEDLWFINGECTLKTLKFRTFGDADSDKWTIWTDDINRWNEARGDVQEGDGGYLYGHQWRGFNKTVDQLQNLIDGIKEDPYGRRHIVMAWNPEDVLWNDMSLPPCHLGFQCYVTGDGKLNLKWWQRSWDVFLGGPFNIASYGLLLHLLAKYTGLEVGRLSCAATDVHIYHNHFDAVKEYLEAETHKLPTLVLPKVVGSNLLALKDVTALDFSGCLVDYKHSGAIKAPLSVGR